MVLGYLFGTFYQRDYAVNKRKKWLLHLGLGGTGRIFCSKRVEFLRRPNTLECPGYVNKKHFVVLRYR